MWHMLKREGIVVARCTVERVMKRLGFKGVARGKRSSLPAKIKRSPAHKTRLIGSSRQIVLISYGLLILRMSPPGKAWHILPLSLMYSLIKTWDGVYPHP